MQQYGVVVLSRSIMPSFKVIGSYSPVSSFAASSVSGSVNNASGSSIISVPVIHHFLSPQYNTRNDN